MQRPPSGAPGRRSALVRLAALGLGIAVAVAVVLFVVRPTPGAMRDATADVRAWADSIGPLAPLLFVAVSASLTVLMFPGPLLAGASGLLFGLALGFPVSLASAVLGASLAFLISRYLAGDAVEHLAGPRLVSLEALVSRRGFVSPGTSIGCASVGATLNRGRQRAASAGSSSASSASATAS